MRSASKKRRLSRLVGSRKRKKRGYVTHATGSPSRQIVGATTTTTPVH